MKVVLDTNVLVSGIFFGGVPGRIVDSWIEKKFSVYATPSIMEEYLKVIATLVDKETELSRHWNSLLPEICHLIADSEKPLAHPLCRDPDDDKFLLCALHARADCLITGDRDLKILSGDFPFKILTPKEFLQIKI